jgi:hypothetical protein
VTQSTENTSVVWALDHRLYDLPRNSRVAKRRDVRENLLTAAHDIETVDALSHLGTSCQLAAGTFTWTGIRYLQDTVTYTFVNGESSSVGGARMLLAWAIWIITTVLVGRLWRIASIWRCSRSPGEWAMTGS